MTTFVHTHSPRCLAPLLLAFALGVSVSSADVRHEVERQQSSGTASDPWHAADVYFGETPGLMEPALVKETKPNYASEARKAGIEGMVRLECIVETDGTIGAVRVRHSLDKGLDAEAIRTVRKWRFRPARLNDVPVRRGIEVEIGFWLGAAYDPQLEWPVDLRKPDNQPQSPGRAAQEVLTVGNLKIKLKYPPDWTLSTDISDDQLIALQRITDREARACSVLKPRPIEMDMMVPVRPHTLEAYAKGIKQEIANDPTMVELVGVGQIGTGHYWIWSEMRRQRPDFSAVAEDEAARMRVTFDDMRIWKFVTAESRQELSVVCYFFNPRGASKEELKDGARRAGADFATIISGISIRPR